MGVTAISLQLTGSAAEGFTARDSGAWTAAPYLRAGLAFAASPMLCVRADVLTTGILQGAAGQLAGQGVATFGEPIVVTTGAGRLRLVLRSRAGPRGRSGAGGVVRAWKGERSW